jgi:hypothetical protein
LEISGRKNWQAIENVALALGDTGELDHDAVRIFATCR